MDPHKQAMLIVNVIGGVAVLGSYAYGLLMYPESRTALWGGLPVTLRPLYTASMLSATAGYFAFTGYLLLATDPSSLRIGGRFGYSFGFGSINVLYALILLASALWLPLTLAMIEQPGTGTWIAVRFVLGVAGAASATLLLAVLFSEPRQPAALHALAVAGLAAFTFQTLCLDALVWPAYF